MESEFMDLAAMNKGMTWLKNIILDIKLWSQSMSSIFFCCDYQTTMHETYNKIHNGKSRQVNLKH
jgi:hypothetical protein